MKDTRTYLLLGFRCTKSLREIVNTYPLADCIHLLQLHIFLYYNIYKMAEKVIEGYVAMSLMRRCGP